jgi:hypothetical protein
MMHVTISVIDPQPRGRVVIDIEPIIRTGAEAPCVRRGAAAADSC